MLNWLRYLLRPNDQWEFILADEGWWQYVERIEWSLPHNDWRWIVRWQVSQALLEDAVPEVIPGIIIRNLRRLHGEA